MTGIGVQGVGSLASPGVSLVGPSDGLCHRWLVVTGGWLVAGIILQRYLEFELQIKLPVGFENIEAGSFFKDLGNFIYRSNCQ